jgi:hypothetical protein
MRTKLAKSSVAMQALILIAIIHQLSDQTPFFRMMGVKPNQLLVLFRTPSLYMPLFAVQMLLAHFHVDLNPVISLDWHKKLTFVFFFHY